MEIQNNLSINENSLEGIGREEDRKTFNNQRKGRGERVSERNIDCFVCIKQCWVLDSTSWNPNRDLVTYLNWQTTTDTVETNPNVRLELKQGDFTSYSWNICVVIIFIQPASISLVYASSESSILAMFGPKGISGPFDVSHIVSLWGKSQLLRKDNKSCLCLDSWMFRTPVSTNVTESSTNDNSILFSRQTALKTLLSDLRLGHKHDAKSH